jgi:hypothetical protein
VPGKQSSRRAQRADGILEEFRKFVIRLLQLDHPVGITVRGDRRCHCCRICGLRVGSESFGDEGARHASKRPTDRSPDHWSDTTDNLFKICLGCHSTSPVLCVLSHGCDFQTSPKRHVHMFRLMGLKHCGSPLTDYCEERTDFDYLPFSIPLALIAFSFHVRVASSRARRHRTADSGLETT